jgi:DNA-binding response OmpR family regulator
MSIALVEPISDRTPIVRGGAPARRRGLLVVAADPGVRDLLAEPLDAAGFDIVTAADAFGTRRRLQQRHIDVVLLDIDLPGLSGLHVCREIRRDPGNAGLPVIMMAGHDRPGALIAAERAGASGLVAKPLHLQDLIRRLHTVL